MAPYNFLLTYYLTGLRCANCLTILVRVIFRKLFVARTFVGILGNTLFLLQVSAGDFLGGFDGVVST